jgi:WD40 repeat protein
MTDAELQQAIEQPALQLGVKLAAGLTQHILEDVGREAGNLPLLQFALTELWERQQYRQLTYEAYQAIGGVHQALARHADKVYQELSKTGQAEKMQPVFVQLVRPGEGTEDTRQVATLAQVRPENQPLIAKLATARLVVTNRDEQNRETVEVVHEALIRHWGLLRKWIDADRAFRLWQNGLREAIRAWQDTGKDNGSLLQGRRLEEAEEKLVQYREAVSDSEQNYIDSSLKFRAKQKFQRAIAVSLVLFLVVVGAVGWQWREVQQKERLREQHQVAQFRQLRAQAMLASVSPNNINGGFDRALLLAAQIFQEQPKDPQRQGSLLDVLTTHPQVTTYLQGHHGAVTNVAFAKNSNKLATACSDKTIILWDMETRQPIGQPLVGHSDAIYDISFDPSGRRLASSSADKSIILWDVDTQQLIGQPLIQHNTWVTRLSFSPDGKWLASGDWDGTIILWDTETQQPNGQPLTGQHHDPITSLSFSPDSTLLASGNRAVRVKGIIILWDVETRQPVGKLRPINDAGNIRVRLAFSPDGKILASGGSDKTIILWDVNTQQSISQPLVGHRGYVKSISFSPDGKQLVSASETSIILWDVDFQRPIGEPLTAHSSAINEVSFISPNLLVSGSNDGSVILWNLNTEYSVGQPLIGHSPIFFTVSFSPDGKKIVSNGKNYNTIALWDVASKQVVAQSSTGHKGLVLSLDFSADSKLIAGGSTDNTIILWDANTLQPIGQPLIGHKDDVLSVSFSPNGKLIASGSADGTVIIWDVDSQQPVGQPLRGHTNEIIYGVRFSPDGKLIASTGYDNTVILWNVNTRQPEGQPLVGHSNIVWRLSFSLDGKQLISGDWDGTIILWDIANQQMIGQPLHGHDGGIAGLDFSPNGKYLISGDFSWHKGSLVLWDIETQKPIGQPIKAYKFLQEVAFSPDGKMAVSCGQNNDITLWDTDPQSWYQKACRIARRNLTLEEWQNYFPNEPYQKTCSQQVSGEALALIEAGEKLAEKAEDQDIKSAITKFDQAFTLDPLLKKYPLYGFNSETKAKKIAAHALVNKGESLAEEEKPVEAIEVFKRAKELDNSLTFDPQQKANQALASALVSKGESLAEEEKMDEAIAMFKHAQLLDSSLTFDPQQKANQLVASALVRKGEESLLLAPGKIDETIVTIKRAQELDTNMEISTYSLNRLCWHGSLFGQAAKVLEYCETAVKRTNEQDADIRDSRGLARALTGNFKGAITDFEFFVQHTNSEEKKKQRQDWIKALKKGDNPFTEEVLESLK